MNKHYTFHLKFYNKKSTHYAKESGIVFSKLLDLFISKLKIKEVLDLGCGPGHDSNYFFEKGIKVAGIDASLSMINLAKNKYGEKIDFRVDNALSRNFFRKYSIKNVWISAMLMHLEKKDRMCFLKKLNRFMKKDSILGIIIPRKKSSDMRKIKWEKSGGVFDTFSEKEARALIEMNNFKIIEIKKFNFHKFPWLFILSKK